MNKIGFIGAGKMATAIIKGIIDSKFCNSKDILVSDVNEDALKKMQSDLNITPAKSNNDVVKNSDIVFFAVKPFVLKDVLSGVQEDFLDDNGVNNEDIRNAYIDSYVCNNTKLDLMQEKLKREMQYTIFPDLYLMFANATEDDKIVQKWEETLAGNNNIEELRTEILEYLEYMQSEDFEDDMNSNLEEI